MEFVLDTNPVNNDDMLVVKEVARELIIHPDPVLEVVARHEGKADLHADISLECADSRLSLALRNLLHRDEDVERLFEVPDEYSSNREEVDGPRLPETREEILTIDRRRLKEEGLERLELTKVFVEGVAQDLHLLGLTIDSDEHVTLDDYPCFLECGQLGPSSTPRETSPTTDIVEGEFP